MSWTHFCVVTSQTINSVLPNVQKRILFILGLRQSMRNTSNNQTTTHLYKSKNTKLELLAFFVRIGGQNKGLGLKLHPFNIYPVI